MNFTTAITRKPGLTFAAGLTTVSNAKPRYDRIMRQHEAYINVLNELDLNTIILEPLEAYPDAYFVEDVAVVTRKKAIVTRPGALSRRGETDFITSVLKNFRDLAHIQSPGTLDGGDVLIVDDHCFIGISQRTNESGAKQLGAILEEEGIKWTPIHVKGGLHLKSDVNYIGRSTLLLTKKMADWDEFKPYEQIIVDENETYAANSLLVNGQVLTPAGFPNTKAKLLQGGFDLIELETSEIQKMDGGLTCMSLRI